MAAESDHPEVVKLFLKLKPDLSTLTATVSMMLSRLTERNECHFVFVLQDENGFTCAHIAAMKGSVAVIKELMLIDKTMVIEAKTKVPRFTLPHLVPS